MKYEDFCKQLELRETIPNEKNNLIAANFLLKYLQTIKEKELSYPTGNPIEDLLYEYFSLKGTEKEENFIKLLNDYHFKYSMSIHNAIYYLLATPREFIENIDPLSWPGMQNIKRDNANYKLETILGNIEVYKASQIFSKTPSYHIFHKNLMGECYERTYDFLKENTDYLAVLSYMPNFFYGGHYHAYLEKENQILDIASNAFYPSKESAKKILCGEIVAKLSWKQVQEKFKQIKNTTKNINSRQKLLTLTLYYDRKNHQKKK